MTAPMRPGICPDCPVCGQPCDSVTETKPSPRRMCYDPRSLDERLRTWMSYEPCGHVVEKGSP